MKKFVIYDQIKNGDCFDRIIEAENESDAIYEAKCEWEHMSSYDQSRRSDFFLATCEIDEDNSPDWNTAEIILQLK
ncbi:MAG: hypothetical protein IJ038_05135 [Clostridia bacterium]|nr:hypothetical protein [Clostridia bacterium]